MEDVGSVSCKGTPQHTELRARSRLRWFFVILCGLGISIASSISGDSIPRGLPAHFDKIVHFTEFALLGFLVMRAVLMSRLRSGRPSAAPIVIVFAVAALVCVFGGLDELRQMFTPGRDVSGYDLIADGAGGLVGASAGWLFGGLS